MVPPVAPSPDNSEAGPLRNSICSRLPTSMGRPVMVRRTDLDAVVERVDLIAAKPRIEKTAGAPGESPAVTPTAACTASEVVRSPRSDERLLVDHLDRRRRLAWRKPEPACAFGDDVGVKRCRYWRRASRPRLERRPAPASAPSPPRVACLARRGVDGFRRVVITSICLSCSLRRLGLRRGLSVRADSLWPVREPQASPKRRRRASNRRLMLRPQNQRFQL